MNLHAVPTLALDLEPEEPELDPYECPECGCAKWERRESGNYTERHTVDFSAGRYAAEDWNDNDQEMFDCDQWCCWNCGTPATDEISDYIDENR